MLRDRYAPVDLFALASMLALKFEPVLARLDTLLDDDVLFRAVHDDLARRYPRTRETGRPSTPVEVLLRMLIVAVVRLELRRDGAVRERQPGPAAVLPAGAGAPAGRHHAAAPGRPDPTGDPGAAAGPRGGARPAGSRAAPGFPRRLTLRLLGLGAPPLQGQEAVGRT